MRASPFITAVCLSLCCQAPNAWGQERNWTIVSSLALSSDYVFRGLSQSSERPVVQFGGGLRTTTGAYLHLLASSVDTERLAPDFGGHGIEINLMAGMSRPVDDDWHWDINFSQYQTNHTDQILDYDYSEVGASIGYQDLVRISAAYSWRATDHARDNAKLRGPRRAVEVAGQWPVSPRLSLTGGVGYSDLSKVSDVTHYYWSTGLTYRSGRYQGTLMVVGTDDDARERFIDDRADTRLVASFIITFGGAR